MNFKWPRVATGNASNAPRSIHLRACRTYKNAKNTRPAHPREIRRGEACGQCLGGYQGDVTQDNSFYTALKEAANGD